MADFEERRSDTLKPKRKKPNVRWVIAIALIGIFVVLTLSNLKALRAPFDALSAVLAPVVTGLVIAYVLNFFVRFFEYKLFKKKTHRKRKRALSMLLAYLLFLAILAGIADIVQQKSLYLQPRVLLQQDAGAEGSHHFVLGKKVGGALYVAVDDEGIKEVGELPGG